MNKFNDPIENLFKGAPGERAEVSESRQRPSGGAVGKVLLGAAKAGEKLRAGITRTPEASDEVVRKRVTTHFSSRWYWVVAAAGAAGAQMLLAWWGR